jgi:hypothetical protein
MRTTVTIDDSLYRTVKARAAQAGRTVSAVIEDAIRASLDRGRPGAEPEELPVYGGSGVQPGVDLTSDAALRDRMDENVPLDAVR